MSVETKVWLADPRFLRDVKQLKKKWPTLEDDLHTLCQAISAEPRLLHHLGVPINRTSLTCSLYKLRKIASRSFPGKGIHSGFRMVIAKAFEETMCLDVYHKSQQDQARIERYHCSSARCLPWTTG
jgi:hypothetical protein